MNECEQVHMFVKPFMDKEISRAANFLSCFRPSIRINQTVHQERNRFKCHLCPQTYSLKTGLCKHISNHHRDRVVYQCSSCEKTLLNAISLNYHMQVGHRDKEWPTYSCEKFGYTSFVKSNLTSHSKRVHGGVKRQVCYFCRKKLYDFPDLCCHIKCHTLEI